MRDVGKAVAYGKERSVDGARIIRHGDSAYVELVPKGRVDTAGRAAPVTVYLPGGRGRTDTGLIDLASAEALMHSKVASAPEEAFVTALIKGAERKKAEIEKQVVPSQLAGQAIPVLTRTEADLPDSVLSAMAAKPVDEALSTASGLCIVIKPREFQRIMLIHMGKKPLADALDSGNILFPRVDDLADDLELSPDKYLLGLGRMLSRFFDHRSALAPAIERRVVLAFDPGAGSVPSSSHSSELLRKIGSAYNSYRSQLLSMAPYAQTLIAKTAASTDAELRKVASAHPENIFTPLSYLYLRDAYMDGASFGADTRVVLQLS
jgi:hypothetical protein